VEEVKTLVTREGTMKYRAEVNGSEHKAEFLTAA
jgi:hypothetical protein